MPGRTSITVSPGHRRERDAVVRRGEESKRRCRVRFFPLPSVQPRGGAHAEREKGRREEEGRERERDVGKKGGGRRLRRA